MCVLSKDSLSEMKPDIETLDDAAYEFGANDMYVAEQQRIDALIEKYLATHEADEALTVLFDKIQGAK